MRIEQVYSDKIAELYLRVGQHEFMARGVSDIINVWEIVRFKNRNVIVDAGGADHYRSMRKWRISPQLCLKLVEEYGNVHAPTGQEKIIYEYQNSRKRNNS